MTISVKYKSILLQRRKISCLAARLPFRSSYLARPNPFSQATWRPLCQILLSEEMETQRSPLSYHNPWLFKDNCSDLFLKALLLPLFLYLQYPVWSGRIKRSGHIGGGTDIWNIHVAAHPIGMASPSQIFSTLSSQS